MNSVVSEDVRRFNLDRGLQDIVLLLQALSSMLAGKEEAVPHDMLPQVAACLLECLAGHCSSKNALPLDRPSSRYFCTILRTMQAAVSQVRRPGQLQSVSYMLSCSCCSLPAWVAPQGDKRYLSVASLTFT